MLCVEDLTRCRLLLPVTAILLFRTVVLHPYPAPCHVFRQLVYRMGESRSNNHRKMATAVNTSSIRSPRRAEGIRIAYALLRLSSRSSSSEFPITCTSLDELSPTFLVSLVLPFGSPLLASVLSMFVFFSRVFGLRWVAVWHRRGVLLLR